MHNAYTVFMTLNHRISVLIPCHSTNFLSECIYSIQQQTMSKNDFEVVVVADRVDQAVVADILDDSQLQFRIISSVNPGIVAALNTGLENIFSEYVARMDGDDLMFPDRLQSQLEYLEKTSICDAVGGQLEQIDMQGFRIGDSKFRNKIGSSYKELLSSSPLAHPASMIRRSALSQIGGYRDFLAEDWDLWVRLRRNGELHNLSQKVIKYRIHNNQHSRNEMFAKSHARLIVGVSYFARQENYADEPKSFSELEVWLVEAMTFLRRNSIKFRFFLRWAKRLDAYQQKFNGFATTRNISIGLALLIQYPIWFTKAVLKKVFTNQ